MAKRDIQGLYRAALGDLWGSKGMWMLVLTVAALAGLLYLTFHDQ